MGFFRECEQQVAELKTAQEIQSHQAEHAIEDFKTQVRAAASEGLYVYPNCTCLIVRVHVQP